MTISPFTLKPQRASSFSTRCFSSPSCIGENLLNSGAIHVG